MIFPTALLQRLALLLVVISATITLAQDATTTPDAFTPLPPPEDIEALQEALILDDSCLLSCFLGFRPEVTSENDVLSFAPVDYDIDGLERYSTSFILEQNETKTSSLFRLELIVEDEILREIIVTFTDAGDWLPPETFDMRAVLMNQTTTPEIYISLNLTTFRVAVMFYYSEVEFLAQYIMPIQIEGNVFSGESEMPLLLCPDLESHDFIKFWLGNNSDSDLTLPERYLIGFDPNDDIEAYWDIQRMTGLDEETFVEAIIESPHECIELPSLRQLNEWNYSNS